jgi:hypothetical protein
MTAQEIINLASTNYADETIDNTFGLNALNEAIHNELPPEAWPEADANVVAVYDTWANLPADFVQVLEIRQGTLVYDGPYDIRSRRIRFPTSATFTISYRQFPARLTDVNVTPAGDAYHEILAIWVAAKWMQKEDSEDPQGKHLESLFRQKVIEVQAVLDWPKQDRPAVVREVY